MEKSIKGTRTEQNLLKAFAGESQARSRYVFFASQAKKEGYEQIAGVFLETAEQEKEHAKRFFKFLEGGEVTITASYPAGKIGTTQDGVLNLNSSDPFAILGVAAMFLIIGLGVYEVTAAPGEKKPLNELLKDD